MCRSSGTGKIYIGKDSVGSARYMGPRTHDAPHLARVVSSSQMGRLTERVVTRLHRPRCSAIGECSGT